MKRSLCLLIGFLSVILLFSNSEAVQQGIFDGGKICLDVLLPSIFPFMIVTSFLSLSGALSLPGKLLQPLFGILGAEKPLAEVWLSSFIGGYPTGAHTLSVMVQQGLLPRKQAERFLRCCVNPGPAFLVLAVGQGMLGSRHIGFLLLLSQLVSSILLCALLCRKNRDSQVDMTVKQPKSISDAFVTAVSGSSGAMINIFAYVLVFAVLLSLLNSYDKRIILVAASFEVTLGCATAAQLGGKAGLLLTAFFIGFGGFSVGFQALSLARQAQIMPTGFWRARLFSGLINAAVFWTILFFDKTAILTMTTNAPPMAVWSVDRLLGAACISAMLLLSFKKIEPACRFK